MPDNPAVSNYHDMVTTLLISSLLENLTFRTGWKMWWHDITFLILQDMTGYVVSSQDTRHQNWGRCIHTFLKCFNEVTFNSKASYRVSWMSDSSLKIYYGKEEGRNLFAVLFPCNLRQGRFWALWGSHGSVVEEAIHLAYDSVSLCLSSRVSRPLKDDSTTFLRNVGDYVVTRSHIAEESHQEKVSVFLNEDAAWQAWLRLFKLHT
jgi:hypothetical protein